MIFSPKNYAATITTFFLGFIPILPPISFFVARVILRSRAEDIINKSPLAKITTGVVNDKKLTETPSRVGPAKQVVRDKNNSKISMVGSEIRGSNENNLETPLSQKSDTGDTLHGDFSNRDIDRPRTSTDQKETGEKQGPEPGQTEEQAKKERAERHQDYEAGDEQEKTSKRPTEDEAGFEDIVMGKDGELNTKNGVTNEDGLTAKIIDISDPYRERVETPDQKTGSRRNTPENREQEAA
ncbi:MAG: hypothetical protein NTY66_02980 [Candidatus Vogelbacteria bacterium]|nr:hypothetical protein [Candidatus Vogelbacteria bacterium]